MTSAFSSSDTAVLERQADLLDVEREVSLEEIWSDSQRETCFEWIKSNGYKRVRSRSLMTI